MLAVVIAWRRIIWLALLALLIRNKAKTIKLWNIWSLIPHILININTNNRHFIIYKIIIKTNSNFIDWSQHHNLPWSSNLSHLIINVYINRFNKKKGQNLIKSRKMTINLDSSLKTSKEKERETNFSIYL